MTKNTAVITVANWFSSIYDEVLRIVLNQLGDNSDKNMNRNDVMVKNRM